MTTPQDAGYEFDPETLPALIREFEDIAEDSRKFENEIREASAVATAPAPEVQSETYLAAYRASLDDAAKEAKGATAYLDGLVQSMKKALADYRGAEDRNAQDLRRNRT
ncbi:hypothetical protein [Sciscionella sediminilitoris]|uniref:hypothetical protein n=1 Tax=Sciscionella sediminilitoris TaxID=1445613 RepID=UPI0004DFBD01|nr:hypothetical protein [Sciscionella sp. SE31]